MSLHLQPKRPLPKEFRRVGLRLADETLAFLREGNVHQTRRRIKELRALLTLVKGDALAADLESRFRDVARAISGERDNAICLSALTRLEKEADAPSITAFEDARTLLAEHAAPPGDHAPLLALLEECRNELADWHPEVCGKTIRKAVKRSYRRCRKLLKRRMLPEDFHPLRRRLKRLWAQLVLLQKKRPKAMKRRICDIDHVAETLGLEHDLAVLEQRLGHSKKARPLLSAIAKHRQALQHSSCAAARPLLHRKPKRFVDKILKKSG